MNPELVATMLAAFKGLLAERAEISAEEDRLREISRRSCEAHIEMIERRGFYTALCNSTARWLVAAGIPWADVAALAPNVRRSYEEEENFILFGREVPL